MRKSLTAVAAAATLALASVAVPQHAEARGGRVAAGILGGLFAGALIGAAATHGPYYGPGPYYYDDPDYGPPPPRCWWERDRYWNGYSWHWHRVRVCE